MELRWPIALLALAAVVPAWWLAQRARGRAALHPLWFLVEPGPRRPRRRRGRRSRFVLVVAVALLALAAAGPVVRSQRGARVLVVDESATRTLDLAAVRARLASFDEAVLVAPGRAPRRMAASAAAAELAPSRSTVSAAEVAAGVTAALSGARTVDVEMAPAPGDDVAIASVTVHRDPLAARRARLVVELALHGAAAPPAAVNGVAPVRAGDRAYAVVPYEGDGAEAITIALEPAAADRLALDDTATVTLPSLAAATIWIDPSLDGTPISRAIAVIPTATRVNAPAADAIAVVPTTAWTGPARARIVINAPPSASAAEPLLAVAGSPLVGATPALLAAMPAAAVAVDAARAAPADRVWLRAGSHAAIWADAEPRPTLHITAALDGPVLPIVLADALAAAPLAAPALVDIADVRTPPPAPSLHLAGSRDHTRGWPVRALLALAALLVVIEAIATRPRRAAIAARLVALAGIALVAARAVEPPHRRVVFVLDVSDSMTPAAAAARDAIAQRAAVLGHDDRAALVLVAGGARVVVPLGPPSSVAAWARHASIDPTTLGLDSTRTDLGAGLALAGRTLGGAGGDLVLVGDGRDSTRGIAAVRDAPELIARGFSFVPIDTGEDVRIVPSSTTLRAAPGRAFAVPVEIEARVARDVDVSVSHHGHVIGRRTLRAPVGRTRAIVDAVLDQPGTAELEVAIASQARPARVHVEVGVAGRTLRLDASSIAALTPSALAAVDAVVLAGVPGGALDRPAVDALEAFVTGGGTLLWSAGPTVGAADAARLAALLPLRPATSAHTALVLVVDRSGSIDAAGRQIALPGAAELAAAAHTLGPDDRFGAIAFDSAPTDWIALAPAGTERMVPALPPARGGTDPAPALALAGRRLATTPANMQRVAVLVSDGGFAASADRTVAVVRELAGAGIRVEVIAVGTLDDAARTRLTNVATAGGGRLHIPTGGIAAALPAVRIVPLPAATTAIARARDTWSTMLGPLPAPLVDGAPVARHIALEPTPDAVVLADAGPDPLLALRPHGAGRVLAWTADLDGAWIDRALAGAVLDAIDDAPLDALTLEVSSDRSVRAMTVIDGVAPIPARMVAADGAITPLALIPSTPGTFVARIDSSSPAIAIEAGGVRLPIAPLDREHDHLGAAPEIGALERAAPLVDHEMVWSLVPLAAIALIIIVWILLKLPER